MARQSWIGASGGVDDDVSPLFGDSPKLTKSGASGS
jgi:hypothetical protein